MRRLSLLFATVFLVAPLTARAQDSTSVFPQRLPAALAAGIDEDVVLQAIEHSDAYYTRLTIHRIGSYAVLPLFAGEYYLGNKLINGTSSDWVKPVHTAAAITIGGLFVSNTVTGVWNLIESRHDREGRGRRLLHAGLMLAADAGFAYTGTLAGDASDLGTRADRHRNAALTSMGLATAGTLLMWLR